MQVVNNFEKIVFKWFVMCELLLVFWQISENVEQPIQQDMVTILLQLF